MTSGFVKAGHSQGAAAPQEQDDEWSRAIKAAQGAKVEKATGLQDNGKTLYEVLQENKARAREEQEAKLKLSNQFRSLDDDEAGFLDSVTESLRAREEAAAEETRQQLEAFRKLQNEPLSSIKEAIEGAGRDASQISGLALDGGWAAPARKKRKAEASAAIQGVKIRKTSSSEESKLFTGVVRPSEGDQTPESSMAPPVITDEGNPVLPAVVKKPVSISSKETATSQTKRSTLLGIDYESDSSR